MQNSLNRGSGFSTKVLNIIEGIIYVSYTADAALYREVFNINSELIGFVNAIYSDYIEVILITNIKIEIFEILMIGFNTISIKFNNNILGSIINPLGDYITHFTVKENFYHQNQEEIFSSAPNINKRSKIDEQLLTGHNIIDFLFPIGYGQRMMLIGDTKIYKTTNAIKIIKTILENRRLIKRDLKTIFIYVSIGQKSIHLKEVLDYMVTNTVGNTLIISSGCNDPLGMQFLTPYSAFAIANYYAKQGYHIIIILDDLSKHAISYRELMLLAKKPYGRDYYPSDIFYRHSSMLERAFYNISGSITALMLTETFDEEITSYINTNIISITDGQLVFAKELLKTGITPAISTKYSVSRVGFAAQTKILNKISTYCSIALSNYYNNIDFYNMYKDNCDKNIKEKIYAGLYVKKILYSVFEDKTLNYIQQIIISTLIDNKIFFDEYDLLTIEKQSFLNQIRSTISKVYDIVTKDEQMMHNIEKKYK